MDEDALLTPYTSLSPPITKPNIIHISQSFANYHMPIYERIKKRYPNKKKIHSTFIPWKRIIGFQVPDNA